MAAWARGGSGGGEKWLGSGYTGKIDINVNNPQVTLVLRSPWEGQAVKCGSVSYLRVDCTGANVCPS